MRVKLALKSEDKERVIEAAHRLAECIASAPYFAGGGDGGSWPWALSQSYARSDVGWIDPDTDEEIAKLVQENSWGISWTTSNDNYVEIGWNNKTERGYVLFDARRHALHDPANGVGMAFEALGGIDWAKKAEILDGPGRIPFPTLHGGNAEFYLVQKPSRRSEPKIQRGVITNG